MITCELPYFLSLLLALLAFVTIMATHWSGQWSISFLSYFAAPMVALNGCFFGAIWGMGFSIVVRVGVTSTILAD